MSRAAPASWVHRFRWPVAIFLLTGVVAILVRSWPESRPGSRTVLGTWAFASEEFAARAAAAIATSEVSAADRSRLQSEAHRQAEEAKGLTYEFQPAEMACTRKGQRTATACTYEGVARNILVVHPADTQALRTVLTIQADPDLVLMDTQQGLPLPLRRVAAP